MTSSEYCIIEGRRPAGSSPRLGASGASELAELLADLAGARAASAVAYARLARELRLHGAPDGLADACEEASATDRALARELGSLARERGGAPCAPRAATVRVRTLAELALDNVVEGCVRETYGALVAEHRADTAADPGVRAIMLTVARACATRRALAFDLATWLQARIDPIEAAIVEDTLHHAVRRLAWELDVEPSAELVTSAGLPDRRAALGLWSALAKTVWRTEAERVWRVVETELAA